MPCKKWTRNSEEVNTGVGKGIVEYRLREEADDVINATSRPLKAKKMQHFGVNRSLP